jgi:stage II sporulation protein D
VAAGGSLPLTEVRAENGRIVLGSQVLGAGEAEIVPERNGSVRVRQAVGGAARERGYRGSVRILLAPEGLLRVINVLNLEAYVAGVVCQEMPSAWDPKALEAQAVAARTYALAEHNSHIGKDFDLYDSTFSQAYAGLAGETEKSRRAATATRGIVGTCRGRNGRPALVPMYYHSTCGGMTEAAGAVFGGETLPPLRGGVTCRYCYRSKKYQWSGVTVTKREIAEAMHRSADPAVQRLGPIRRVEVAAETPGGRVAALRLTDAQGSQATVRCSQFRILVGATRVTSNWFAMEDLGDAIRFGGRGNGHGVGLCQYGAEYLAEKGKTGVEILRYYYPGIELARAY